MSRYLEHGLQQCCATYLARALPPTATWTSVDMATDQHMNVVAGARRKARGLRAGWPDVQVIYEGRLFGVELKIGEGRQSPAQQFMQAEIERAGGKYAICRSVEDVERALMVWRIPLRAHTMAAGEYDARRLARMEVPRHVSKARQQSPDRAALAALARARKAGVFA